MFNYILTEQNYNYQYVFVQKKLLQTPFLIFFNILNRFLSAKIIPKKTQSKLPK